MNGLLQSVFSWLSRLVSRNSSDKKTPTPEPMPIEKQSEKDRGKEVSIPWGNSVSQTFRDRVVWCADSLGVEVDYLMAVMAWESARTFRSDIRNMAGSGATGLIQFMPATARGLGTNTDELAKMTPEDQLNYVYRYFLPYRGRLKTLSDVYMAVLWPRAIGKPEGYVLWNKASRPTTYRQNAGLDIDGDESITKAEAARKVEIELYRGMLPENKWVGVVYPDS